MAERSTPRKRKLKRLAEQVEETAERIEANTAVLDEAEKRVEVLTKAAELMERMKDLPTERDVSKLQRRLSTLETHTSTKYGETCTCRRCERERARADGTLLIEPMHRSYGPVTIAEPDEEEPEPLPGEGGISVADRRENGTGGNGE